MNWYKRIILANVEALINSLSLPRDIYSFIAGSNPKVKNAALAILMPLIRQNKTLPTLDELKSQLKVLSSKPRSRSENPFSIQKRKYIDQGFSEDIVNNYLQRFNEIRKNKPKEANEVEVPGIRNKLDIFEYQDFRTLENFVDGVVAASRKVEQSNFEDVEFDAEPVAKNGPIEVYYANGPRACIHYVGNIPYTWCIARKDTSNMFYNYRFGDHEPTFYFVKNKERTRKEFKVWNLLKNVVNLKWKDPYHFFVIQVIGNARIEDENARQYLVSSANNDGDKPMSWKEILGIEPLLSGMQQVFKPQPLSEEEKDVYNRFKDGISDEEFAKLSDRDKNHYLEIYPRINRGISTNQFENLPRNLKNKYIGFGIGLNDEQYENIKNDKALVKRYKQITNRKFDELLKADKEQGENFSFTHNEGKLLEHRKEWIIAITKFIEKYDRPPRFAENWVKQKLENGDYPREWVIAITKFIEKYGYPPIFAENWAKQKLESENYPKEWVNIINKFIKEYGDPPIFAENWAKQKLESGNYPKEWRIAITKFIEKYGYASDFAKNWAKQKLESGDYPEEWEIAITKFIKEYGNPPSFAENWVKQNKYI